MSQDIGPGDFVECAPPAEYRGTIDAAQLKISGSYPRRGEIYQVREIGTYRNDDGLTPGVRLVGLVVSYPGHPDCWFNANCFRPIYRPKSSLIEGLKQPVREAEEA